MMALSDQILRLALITTWQSVLQNLIFMNERIVYFIVTSYLCGLNVVCHLKWEELWSVPQKCALCGTRTPLMPLPN